LKTEQSLSGSRERGDKGSMKIEEFVNFINSEIKKEIAFLMHYR